MRALSIDTVKPGRDEPPWFFARAIWNDLPTDNAVALVGSAADRDPTVARGIAVAEAVERRAMFHSHQAEPERFRGSSVGWAAGETIDSAIRAAQLEIIERRAYEALAGGEALLTRVGDDLVPDMGLGRYRLDRLMYRFGLPTQIDVVVTVLVDKTGNGPHASVGVAAGTDLAHACESATREAIKARLWAYTLDPSVQPASSPDSSVSRLLYYAYQAPHDECVHVFQSRNIDLPAPAIDYTRPFDDRATQALAELHTTLSIEYPTARVIAALPFACPVAAAISDPSPTVLEQVLVDGSFHLNPHV